METMKISCFTLALRGESLNLSVLLAACKFLDTTVVLNVEDFQWYAFLKYSQVSRILTLVMAQKAPLDFRFRVFGSHSKIRV